MCWAVEIKQRGEQGGLDVCSTMEQQQHEEEEEVVGAEQTSANPRHRVFLSPGVFVNMRRTHSMRHTVERMSGKTVF